MRVISPQNEKGQRHGDVRYYWKTGNLRFEGSYFNGKRVGLRKWYDLDGVTLRIKTYII